MAAAFDTLTYARRLREVGVPQEQAEAHAEALAAAVTETLATKQDLRDLAAATKEDLRELAAATKQDLQEVKQDLRALALSTKQGLREQAVASKQDLRELELRLSIRLGGMLGVSVAAVAALVKLL